MILGSIFSNKHFLTNKHSTQCQNDLVTFHMSMSLNIVDYVIILKVENTCDNYMYYVWDYVLYIIPTLCS